MAYLRPDYAAVVVKIIKELGGMNQECFLIL
jgi:hypothetical protein